MAHIYVFTAKSLLFTGTVFLGLP